MTSFQCDDIEENEDFHRCEDTLANELAQCLAACGGASSCIIGCSSNYETDLKNCPCMEGCPQGCPCAEYDCSFIPTTTTSTTTTTTTTSTTTTTTTTTSTTTTSTTTTSTTTTRTTTPTTTTTTTTTTTDDLSCENPEENEDNIQCELELEEKYAQDRFKT